MVANVELESAGAHANRHHHHMTKEMKPVDRRLRTSISAMDLSKRFMKSRTMRSTREGSLASQSSPKYCVTCFIAACAFSSYSCDATHKN